MTVKAQYDWQQPSLSLLVKLGSVARHAGEYIGPLGHPIDAEAIKGLLADPEVEEWLERLDAIGLLPVKR